MPLEPKEKMRRYRAKLAEHYERKELMKARDRERKRMKKLLMTAEERTAQQQLNRERVAKHRIKMHAQQKPSQLQVVFESAQGLDSPIENSFNQDTGKSKRRLFRKDVEAGGMLHYREKDGRFICSFCRRRFATSTKLKKHVTIHTEKALCGKAFIEKRKLGAHVRMRYKQEDRNHITEVDNSVVTFQYAASSDSLIHSDDEKGTSYVEAAEGLDPNSLVKTEDVKPCGLDNSELSLSFDQPQDCCDETSENLDQKSKIKMENEDGGLIVPNLIMQIEVTDTETIKTEPYDTEIPELSMSCKQSQDIYDQERS